MYCRYCGTEFHGNFCPKCGTKAPLEGETNAGATAQEGFKSIKHRKLIRIWFWSSAVILLGTGVFANYAGNYVFGIFLLLCSLLSIPLWLSTRHYQLENHRPPKWISRLMTGGLLVFFLAWLWIVLLLVSVISDVFRLFWY